MEREKINFTPFLQSHKWIYGEDEKLKVKLISSDVDVHAYARRQELGNFLEPMKPTSLSKKIHLRTTDELVSVSMLHTLGIPEDDDDDDDKVTAIISLAPFQRFIDYFNKYGIEQNDFYKPDYKKRVDNFCETIRKLIESFELNYFFFNEDDEMEDELFLNVKYSPPPPRQPKDQKFVKSLFQTPVASTSSVQKELEPKFQGFLTASNNSIQISEKSLERSKRMFQEVEQDPTIETFAQLDSIIKTQKNQPKLNRPIQQTNIKPTSQMKTLGLSGQTQSLLKCSNKSDDTTPGSPSSSSKTSTISFQKSSLTKEADAIDAAVDKSAVTLMDDEESCDDGSNVERIFLTRPALKRTKIDEEFKQFPEKSEFSEKLKTKRFEIYEEQQSQIISSSEEHRKQRPGHLFTQKQQNKNRLKLKEFFNNENPKDFTESQLIALGMSKINFSLNFKNSKNLTFKVKDPQKTSIGISLQDNVFLPINSNNEITSKEIISAFLSSPGVDPKLVSIKWIENSLKFISLKLFKFELSFPEKCSGVTLTPENVLLQLRYRYDCEIDRVHRSVIRKIVEKNDTAYRRMVLFVADLVQNQSNIDIQLSDGWYSIRACFDKPLIEAVKSKKIQIGTKLILQAAELIGCDDKGYSPLELPPLAALKLSANSTRRAKWDTKLGYYPNPTPIPMSLNSILSNGGISGTLNIVILRIYPMLYAKRSKDKTFIFHSEKVEESLRTQNEVERLANAKALYNQVQMEYEQEEKDDDDEKSNRTIKSKIDIKNISDPIELNDLLKYGGFNEYQFSSEQIENVRKYKEHLRLKKCTEIDNRVKQKLAKHSSSRTTSDAAYVNSLLKMRIIDLVKPQKTVLLFIWNPVEYVLNVLSGEKCVVQLSNATANETREGHVQMTAGRKATFKSMNLSLLNFPANNFRKVSKISEITKLFSPAFDEFDTVGIVVYVGSVTQKFQSIYIADQDMNLLNIKFPESIKRFAYHDLIKSKTILTISNLTWRTSVCQASRELLCFATEATVFNDKKKTKHFEDHLRDLNTKLNEIDLDEFLQNSFSKIVEMNSMENNELD